MSAFPKKYAAPALSFVLLTAAAGLASSAPAAPATCDRQLVMQIDSAKISVEPDGVSIDAFGTSESAGWKSATLVLAAAADGVATADFVACRPEVSAQVLTPIEAHVTLDVDLATTRQIVVRARTNAMTIDISVD
jgi:hypothetical protein